MCERERDGERLRMCSTTTCMHARYYVIPLGNSHNTIILKLLILESAIPETVDSNTPKRSTAKRNKDIKLPALKRAKRSPTKTPKKTPKRSLAKSKIPTKSTRAKGN